MHEAVLKTSCVNIDDNIRKRHVFGLQPQMATFICESCGVQLNKDVVVLTCKMKKKDQEFISDKSTCMESNSDDEVRAHKKLQSQTVILSSIAEAEMQMYEETKSHWLCLLSSA